MLNRAPTAPDPRSLAETDRRADHPTQKSAAQTLVGDDLAVSIDVEGPDVVEHATTTADQHEEATTAVVVLGMRLQVIGEVLNARCEQRDLHLG